MGCGGHLDGWRLRETQPADDISSASADVGLIGLAVMVSGLYSREALPPRADVLTPPT